MSFENSRFLVKQFVPVSNADKLALVAFVEVLTELTMSAKGVRTESPDSPR